MPYGKKAANLKYVYVLKPRLSGTPHQKGQTKMKANMEKTVVTCCFCSLLITY